MINIIVEGGNLGNESARHHVIGHDGYSIWTLTLKGDLKVKRVNLTEEDIKKIDLVNCIYYSELLDLKEMAERCCNLSEKETYKIIDLKHYFKYL